MTFTKKQLKLIDTAIDRVIHGNFICCSEANRKETRRLLRRVVHGQVKVPS